MRQLAAVGASLILVLSVASPVKGYVHNRGWFTTAAIDSNSNGQFDLDVCFGTGHGSAIYQNRAALFAELSRWDDTQPGLFFDQQACGNDNSNIKITWAFFEDGACESSPIPIPAGTTLAVTPIPANVNVGYDEIDIFMNFECSDDFDWEDNDGIANNKFSATATVLHEGGHTLGLRHSSVANVVMSAGGPADCTNHGNVPFLGMDWTLGDDDAEGFCDRSRASPIPPRGSLSSPGVMNRSKEVLSKGDRDA